MVLRDGAKQNRVAERAMGAVAPPWIALRTKAPPCGVASVFRSGGRSGVDGRLRPTVISQAGIKGMAVGIKIVKPQEYEYQVVQDGIVVASAWGRDREHTLAE